MNNNKDTISFDIENKNPEKNQHLNIFGKIGESPDITIIDKNEIEALSAINGKTVIIGCSCNTDIAMLKEAIKKSREKNMAIVLIDTDLMLDNVVINESHTMKLSPQYIDLIEPHIFLHKEQKHIKQQNKFRQRYHSKK